MRSYWIDITVSGTVEAEDEDEAREMAEGFANAMKSALDTRAYPHFEIEVEPRGPRGD